MAINPADYVSVIDNPNYPLQPGTTYIYESQDGSLVRKFAVTHETVEILGVTCVVVRDTVEVDGQLVELTDDWFAQDKHGNVWYLGEDTQEFPSGSTAGSWQAGDNGAEAGIVMLADPKKGDEHDQEHAAGIAEDHFEVLSLQASANVPYGKFHQILKFAETTPLEPGLVEHKFYVPGVGDVLTVNKETGEREELVLVKIEGQGGDDVLVGKVGPDELHGMGGDDDMSGLDGDDTMKGGAGDDTVSGDAGDDSLSGGSGNDELDGGTGKDVLLGGATEGGETGETDTFTGGKGADEFVFAFSVTDGGGEIGSSASNLIITDATKKDELAFDSGGNPLFDSRAELEALVNVSDDGTDVFVEFPHEGGGSVVITLEGLGASARVVDSLKDLNKLVDLEFA